jgi:hypothetical protein
MTGLVAAVHVLGTGSQRQQQQGALPLCFVLIQSHGRMLYRHLNVSEFNQSGSA